MLAVLSHHFWQREIDLLTAGEKGDKPEREEEDDDLDAEIASEGRAAQAARPTRAAAMVEWDG